MSHSHLSSVVTPLLFSTSLPALAQQNILASIKHAARVLNPTHTVLYPSVRPFLVTFAVVLILYGIAKVTALPELARQAMHELVSAITTHQLRQPALSPSSLSQVWLRSCCGSSVAAHLQKCCKTRTSTSGMAMAPESTWTALASQTGKQFCLPCSCAARLSLHHILILAAEPCCSSFATLSRYS